MALSVSYRKLGHVRGVLKVLISAIQSPERASEGVHHFGLPFLELFPSREVLPASKSVA